MFLLEGEERLNAIKAASCTSSWLAGNAKVPSFLKDKVGYALKLESPQWDNCKIILSEPFNCKVYSKGNRLLYEPIVTQEIVNGDGIKIEEEICYFSYQRSIKLLKNQKVL